MSTHIQSFSYCDQCVEKQSDKERKLSNEEVQSRGLDELANQIVANIETIDLRKMARSSIFETTYGFRWKMFNLETGKIVIIKVDTNFKLISVRKSSFNS